MKVAKELKHLVKREKKLAKRINKLTELRLQEFKELCMLRGRLHYETTPLVNQEAVKYLDENLFKVTIGYGMKLPNLSFKSNLGKFLNKTESSIKQVEKQILVLDMLIARARVKHSRVQGDLYTLGLKHG